LDGDRKSIPYDCKYVSRKTVNRHKKIRRKEFGICKRTQHKFRTLKKVEKSRKKGKKGLDGRGRAW